MSSGVVAVAVALGICDVPRSPRVSQNHPGGGDDSRESLNRSLPFDTRLGVTVVRLCCALADVLHRSDNPYYSNYFTCLGRVNFDLFHAEGIAARIPTSPRIISANTIFNVNILINYQGFA